MTVLAHVEIQPVIVVEILGGTGAAGGVEGDQVRAAVALPQAASHGADDLLVGLRLDRAVASKDPDHAGVAVAAAQPFAIGRGVLRIEDLRAGAPFLVPLVAP